MNWKKNLSKMCLTKIEFSDTESRLTLKFHNVSRVVKAETH